MTPVKRRSVVLGAALAPLLALRARAAAATPWSAIVEAARGRPVFWNAWAGDERTNAFISWCAERMRAMHGIAITHVRLRDTAEAVARVVAEKAAGRTSGGSVDLIWLNGPNFLALKEQGLLFGPYAPTLPNWRHVDTVGKPATIVDFTIPVDGFATPWRLAQLVFLYDGAREQAPPRSMPALLEWARRKPGRFTHPVARNFMGFTFLKQALYELIDDPGVLQAPVDPARFDSVTGRLWTWYDALRPHLWRGGRQFPESGPAQRTLFVDGEIDITMSFNIGEASASIASGLFPASVRSFVLERGTIGNASFVAIPFNAANREAAMVLSDFLLSPEAQAHAQDPRQLGTPTVLDLARLPPEERARFDALPRGIATPSNAELGSPLLEPHPSWATELTATWERRIQR